MHNKIESDVSIPSLDLNFNLKVQKYKSLGLSKNEINLFYNSIRDLTESILLDKNKCIEEVFLQTRKLHIIRKNYESDTSYIRDLLRRCKKYGTYSFAIIARHAFIGSELLKSLLSKKLINENDYENFYNSIETVTSTTLREFKKIKNSSDRKNFIDRYGHLRPEHTTYYLNDMMREKKYILIAKKLK